MTNKKLWVGMLVLVLAFGMTVLGCEEEEEENEKIYTEIRITDIDNNMVNKNFTISLIYADDGRTIRTANGVIIKDRVPGHANADGTPVYSNMAYVEFKWEWKGDMTTKKGSGVDSDGLYINGRIELRIEGDTKNATADILVGSVYRYGGGNNISKKYADLSS
jgi:hypothetical protein